MNKRHLFFTLSLLGFFLFVCAHSFENRKQTAQSNPLINQKTLLEPTPTPLTRITILAAGDLSLAREINYQINQRQNPFFLFEKIVPLVQKADWAIANLEGPVIENCPVLRTGYQFCGETQNLDGPAQAGLDAFNLANNHINNFGPQGLGETIQALEARNLNYFGLGKVDFITLKGIKLAFLGFDNTLAPLDKEKLRGEIEKANQLVDWVIINFHWGEDYQSQPNSSQKEIAKIAIEAGADIIIGHHPHTTQPLEYIEGKPVFYSLGNFVFDQLWSAETRKGALVQITLTKDKIIKTKIIPTYINDQYQVELLNQ